VTRLISFIKLAITSIVAPHSHSMVNKPRKASNGAGFVVVIIVDTMKNTLFKIAVDIYFVN